MLRNSKLNLLQMPFDNIPENHSKPPNIVLIVADDLGWADVGWNNSLMLDVTPRLSKLAKSGVILDQ